MTSILNRFIPFKRLGETVRSPCEPAGERRGRRARRLNLAAVGLLLGIMTLAGTFKISRDSDFVLKSLVISGDKVLNIRLPEGHLVSGVVKDSAGSPILGARVGAVDEDGYGGRAGLTDESGAFQIALRPGRYEIAAWPPYSGQADPATFPRLVSATVGHVDVASDVNIGDIVLPDGYVVSGQVTASGRKIGALSGVVVASKTDSKGRPHLAGYALLGGTRDGGTRYAMALPKGKYTRVLTGAQAFSLPPPPGWGPWNLISASSFVTSPLTVSKDLVRNIVLPAASKLSGSVKDKAGRPLHGVLGISVKGSSPAKDGLATAFVVTNGKFVGCLVPGTYDVVYVPTMDTSYAGKATQTHTEVALTEAARTLNITAEDGIVLSGKVKDAAGKLARFGSVALYPVDAPVTGADTLPQIAKVDKKGSYRLCVPPGEYDVQAGADRGAGMLASVLPGMPGMPEYPGESRPLLETLTSLIARLRLAFSRLW
ncbi:MAG: carboxypeptidase-like regulatory domain-containing protein [Acidobacteriota bacterium]